jgi:dihydroneopterin aldolase
MSKIIIEDIELYAYHGHFPEERTIGSRFLVNVEIDAVIDKACESDRLEDTFNYQTAYDIVVDEMKQPSALLENIANRIASRMLNKSEKLRSVKIKIAKMNPPLGGNVKSVAVEVEKNRGI